MGVQEWSRKLADDTRSNTNGLKVATDWLEVSLTTFYFYSALRAPILEFQLNSTINKRGVYKINRDVEY